MERGHSSKSVVNFNKEILFGEIGALIFAPLTAIIASRFFILDATISKFAVAGSIIGAGLFWITTRINDNSSYKNYATSGLLKDMAYFTPVAFLLTLILYYPALYFLSKYFLSTDHKIWISVVFAQFFAFSLFLLGMNLYRYSLHKFFNKEL